MNDDVARKVHLISLGCPKNTVDSERLLGLLQGNGYEITDDPQQAEVVVVNTCGFIGPAKEESLETVMAAHRLKQEGRCQGVIVTGCLVNRYATELAAQLPEADRLLTIAQQPSIVACADELLGRKRRPTLAGRSRVSLTPHHWAYLRIADGCDRQCAFCAIPAIRGPYRSEPPEALVAEARQLAGQGVRELVLVSQDAMRYGADLAGRSQLVELLHRLAVVDGIEWLRLMYTYPARWTPELIEFYAACEKMCAYIDLPLQHIADPVLRRMRRGVTQKQIVELLEKLRRRLPGVGLRSTFIVGFPGETDEQFDELLTFIEETRFDHVAAFLYSPEEGTAAFALDNEVEEQVKEERYRRLTQVQEEISAQLNGELVGTRQVVLVDERDEAHGVCYARLERDAPEIDGQVMVDGQVAAGQFVEVEITAGYAYERHARLLGEPY